jgi:hypothetical protein
MDRPYFTFFRSYFDAVLELEDEKDKLETLMAICSYSLTGEPPEIESKVARAIFTAIKPTIDANIKQYKNGTKAKRKPNGSQTEANSKPNGSEPQTNKDKDKEKDKEYINKKPWFEEPELDAVFKSYIEYRKKNRIPTTDHALELARDKLLKLGKNTPERIAIINQTLENGWRGLFPIDKNKKKTGFNEFEQREYDYGELEKKLIAN